MKKFLLLSLLTSFILLASQCKNDDDNKTPLAPIDQLPPPTQEGKYTFGCLVNGEAWIPRTTTDMVAIYQQGVLSIGADVDSKEESIIFVIRDTSIITDKIYTLNDPPITEAKFYSVEGTVWCDYNSDDTINGYITLSRFDKINYIISGQFKFTTVNSDCDTIRVTDGRFDMKYIP
jgi:hypothetical protein